MAVLGFECYTFRCSACHETDRCLVFIKHGRETDDEPLPVHPSPPVVPATTVQDGPIAALGLFRRLLEKPGRRRGNLLAESKFRYTQCQRTDNK